MPHHHRLPAREGQRCPDRALPPGPPRNTRPSLLPVASHTDRPPAATTAARHGPAGPADHATDPSSHQPRPAHGEGMRDIRPGAARRLPAAINWAVHTRPNWCTTAPPGRAGKHPDLLNSGHCGVAWLCADSQEIRGPSRHGQALSVVAWHAEHRLCPPSLRRLRHGRGTPNSQLCAVLSAIVLVEYQRTSGHAGIAAGRRERAVAAPQSDFDLTWGGVHICAAETFSAGARCMISSRDRLRLRMRRFRQWREREIVEYCRLKVAA